MKYRYGCKSIFKLAHFQIFKLLTIAD